MYLIPMLFSYAVLQTLDRFFQAQSSAMPMVVSSCAALCLHIPLCWVWCSKLGYIALVLPCQWAYQCGLMSFFLLCTWCSRLRVHELFLLFQWKFFGGLESSFDSLSLRLLWFGKLSCKSCLLRGLFGCSYWLVWLTESITWFVGW